MFKDYCENITEQEYRESNRLSYSLLKELSDIGPKVLLEGLKGVDNSGTRLGSIVDKLTTEPGYDPLQEFIITDINLEIEANNTGRLLKWAKDNNTLLTQESDLTEIYNELDIKRPLTLTDEFFLKVDMLLNEDKYLHKNEYDLANTMADTFNNHIFTKDIFNPNPDYEVINQAIIFFNIYGEECKCMIDKILVNHKKKIIYPYDVKTGAESNFMKNFFGFKYYYQGALYTTAIQSIIQTEKEFQGYVVAPFTFIYLSRVNPTFPLKFSMCIDYIEDVMTGFETRSGFTVRGILQLIDDVKWYRENNEFVFTRELLENNGTIKINSPK